MGSPISNPASPRAKPQQPTTKPPGRQQQYLPTESKTTTTHGGDQHDLVPQEESNRLFARVAATTRVLILVGFAISVVWNLLSPVKAWYLTSYSLIEDQRIISSDVNWTMALDSHFVDDLYQSSRVVRSNSGQPERFINVYLDLMVQSKSTSWAPYVNPLHVDPAIGRYCRSGLRPKSQQQREELTTFFHTDIIMWDGIINSVLLDQHDCNVHEVAEAMMCIKGINASTLVNLEWSTNIPPTDPKLAPGLHLWQDILMPDLETCLARRAVLMASPLDDHPLNVLAQEIATNYSLHLHAIAGKHNMYSQVELQDGFHDLSGQYSGIRRARLTGEIMESAQFATPSATTAVRETMWTCAFLNSPKAVSDCFQNRTLTMSAYFLGRYRVQGDTGRYIESRLTDDGVPFGPLTAYEYLPLPRAHELPAPSYVPERNFLESGDLQDLYLQNVLRPEIAKTVPTIEKDTNAMNDALDSAYVCLADQRCAAACDDEISAEGGDTGNNPAWRIAYRRSETCHVNVIAPDFLNPAGYLSPDCLGIGLQDVGAVRVVLSPQALASTGLDEFELQLNGTADPNAILACMLGGRIPQKHQVLPIYFYDLLRPGTQTVLVSVLANGSEQMLLNYFSLASLAGCMVYAYWTLLETINVCRVATTVYQKLRHDTRLLIRVVYGIAELNLSTRVWRRHHWHLTLFSFVSLVSWYIGAVQTRCAWEEEQMISPQGGPLATGYAYVCSAGDALRPLRSFHELIRLGAFCHVFYCIVFRALTMGIERFAFGICLCSFFLGWIPTVLTTLIITQLNAWRMMSPTLMMLHNTVVIVGLWAGALVAWTRWLRGSYFTQICRIFGVLGIKHQQLIPNTVASYLVSKSYFTLAYKVTSRPQEWLPVAVLLESSKSQLELLDIPNYEYTLEKELRDERTPGSSSIDPSGPRGSQLANSTELLIRCATTVKRVPSGKIKDFPVASN